MVNRFPLKTLLALVFIVGAVIYARGRLAGLLGRPKLIISEPALGAPISNPLTTIRGQGPGLAKITMNGEPLTPDDQGNFETRLLLAPGYNIIVFHGADRFGREIKQTLPLIYKNDDD